MPTPTVTVDISAVEAKKGGAQVREELREIRRAVLKTDAAVAALNRRFAGLSGVGSRLETGAAKIRRAKQEAEGFGAQADKVTPKANRLRNTFARLTGSTVKLPGVFKRVAIALSALAAPTAAAGGIGAVTVLASNAASKIDDLTTTLDVAIGRFDRLRVASRELGVGQQTLASGIQSVQDSVTQFLRQGGAGFGNIFDQLGLSQRQLDRLRERPVELFRTITDAIRDLQSTAQQRKILDELGLDREFRNILEVGRGRVNELGAAFAELGGVLSQQTVQAADRAQSVFLAMWEVLRTQLIRAVGDNADAIRRFAEDVLARLPAIIDSVVSSAEWLIRNLREIGIVATTIAGASLGSILGPATMGASTALGALAGLIGGTMIPRLEDFEKQAGDVGRAVDAIADSSNAAGDALKNKLGNSLDDVITRLKAANLEAGGFNEELARTAEFRLRSAQTRLRSLQSVAAEQRTDLQQAERGLSRYGYPPENIEKVSDLGPRVEFTARQQAEKLIGARSSLSETRQKIRDLQDKIQNIRGELGALEKQNKQTGGSTNQLSDELKSFGTEIERSVRTPLQVFEDKMRKINTLVAHGDLTQEEANRAYRQANKAYIEAADAVARYQHELPDVARSQREIAMSAEEMGRKLDENLRQKLNSLVEEQRTPAEAARKRLEELRDLRERIKGKDFSPAKRREYVEAIKRASKEARDDLSKLDDFLENELTNALDTIGNRFTEIMLEGGNAMKALRNTGKAVASELVQAFAKLAFINPIINAISGGSDRATLSGFGNVLSSGISALVGNATGGASFQGVAAAVPRAEGGDVKAGRPYTVGERGIERFVPDQDGTILPNRAPSANGGGKTEIHIHNETDGEVETQRTPMGNKGERIDVKIKNVVNEGFAKGDFDTSMGTRYGVRPKTR